MVVYKYVIKKQFLGPRWPSGSASTTCESKKRRLFQPRVRSPGWKSGEVYLSSSWTVHTRSWVTHPAFFEWGSLKEQRIRPRTPAGFRAHSHHYRKSVMVQDAHLAEVLLVKTSGCDAAVEVGSLRSCLEGLPAGRL